MRAFAVVLVGLLLATVVLVVEAPRTSALATFYAPASVQSNPGTVTGTTDDLARDDQQRATWTEADPTRIAGQPLLFTLETDAAHLDSASAYTWQQVVENTAGDKVFLWTKDQAAPKVVVAKYYKGGVLSSRVVLFSTTAEGIIAKNLAALGDFANLNAWILNNVLYLSFRGVNLKATFTKCDISDVANIASFSNWKSANGNAVPSSGSGSDGNGFDLASSGDVFEAMVTVTTNGNVWVVLDPVNLPNQNDILISRWDGSTWSRDNVIAHEVEALSEPGVIVDSSNDLYVTYTRATATIEVDFKACRFGTQSLDCTSSTNWKKIDNTAGSNLVIKSTTLTNMNRGRPAIASGRIHVTVVYRGDGTVKHNWAILPNGAWNYGEGVDAGQAVPNPPAAVSVIAAATASAHGLFMHPNGRLYLPYRDNTDNTVKMMSWGSGGNWVAPQPAGAFSVDSPVSSQFQDVSGWGKPAAFFYKDFPSFNLTADIYPVDGFSWLRPSGDSTPLQWNVKGPCIPNTHAGCVDDDPIQDGNGTYLWMQANGVNKVDNLTIADWPLQTDVSFTSVSSFTWGRANTTAFDDYTLRIEDGTAQCAVQDPVLTVVFSNYSQSFASACSGGPWTLAKINALTQRHIKGGNIGGDTQEFTAAGVVVTYSDHDFQVQGYVNFTGIPSGSQVVLYYRGYHTLPGSDTLSLQVDRGAIGSPSWTTLISPFLSSVEGAYNTLTLNPATDLLNGQVRFRVIDTVTNDETGGTFLLNWFSIAADLNPPPPVGSAGVLLLQCTPGIWDLACTVRLNDSVPTGIHILETTWYVNGALKQAGGANVLLGGRGQSAKLSAFSIVGTWTVDVAASLDNHQIVNARTTVQQDNVPIVVVAIFLGVAIASILLLRNRGKRQPAEQRPNPRNDLDAPSRNPRSRMSHYLLPLAMMGALLLGATAGAPGARAGDPPTSSYIRVEVEAPIVYTWESFTITIESRLLENRSGNMTWIPNPHTVSVQLVDESDDVVVQERQEPLLNGTAQVIVFVEETWTDARMRVIVHDPATGLLATAAFRTEMSMKYVLYRNQLDIWNSYVVFSNNVRADHDASIAQDRLISGSFAGSAVFIVLILAVRADHRRSKRVNATSAWDLTSRRLFPFNLPTEEFDVYLDVEHTWDPAAARAFQANRADAHVAKLELQKQEIDKEIEGVRAGVIA